MRYEPPVCLPKDLFRVLRRTAPETDDGIKLMVATRHGPKEIWCPKQHINLYRYREDGQAVFEVAIPENIAERAGLV